jgi:hypothetical protein
MGRDFPYGYVPRGRTLNPGLRSAGNVVDDLGPPDQERAGPGS